MNIDLEKFERSKGRKKGQDVNYDAFGEDVLLMEQKVKSDKKRPDKPVVPKQEKIFDERIVQHMNRGKLKPAPA